MSIKQNKAPKPRKIARKALMSAQVVGIVAGGATACSSGNSLYENLPPDAGIPVRLLIVALVPVIWLFLSVAWHAVLNIAAYAETLDKRILAACLGVALYAFGCSTSGWFVVNMIDGFSALQSYQRDFIGKLQTGFEIAYLNRSAERPIISIATTGATGLQSLADNEKTGVLSGKPGQGKVFKTLTMASKTLRDKVNDLESADRLRTMKLNDAQTAIDEANEAITEHDTATFEAAVNKSSKALGEADKIRLSDEISGLGIGILKTPEIEKTFSDINQEAQLIAEHRRELVPPRYVPISRLKAVTVNPSALPWIVALVIEGAPLMMLAILLTLWRTENDDDDALPPSATQEIDPQLYPRFRPSIVPGE